MAVEQWARDKPCGVEQRAPPIFGRATVTLGIGPHVESAILRGWVISRLIFRLKGYVSR